MRLKQQIILMMSLALLTPALLICGISIYTINNKARADIEEYRKDEFIKLQQYLKHITDVAYGLIETRYDSAVNTLSDSTGSSGDAMKAAMEQCLMELSKIRFDNGEGYFWVTDNKLPFPTMLMHAEKRNLEGETLSDPKYNVEKANGRNIYQIRAELSNKNKDAFVEYVMKKPGTSEVENKISYSRLFAPLGWIISTGLYTDQIDAAIALKKEALSKQITQIITLIGSIALTILIIGLIASFYFSKQLTRAILSIQEKLKQLSLGEQVDEASTNRKDEVGDMIYSLNALVSGLKTYTAFAKEIGGGNLTQPFDPLSKKDVLGTELLQMRDNLKKGNDEKNIRDWTNEGLAMLSDVLRRNNSDTQTLANEILRDLINYLKISQGSLFFIKEDEQQNRYLEMIATYAYDRKKYITKQVAIGEGLIGQCVLDRHITYLTVVPKDYINITSGLGEALPTALLIVPMLYYETVHGVIELASFRKFEDHEIKFIEKIAENIAATIAAVQTNEKTKQLLKESQQMSEQFRSQEEELRQNQEELQSTQEEMQRRLRELELENATLRKGRD